MPLLLRRKVQPDPPSIAVRHGADAYEVELRRRAGAKRITLRVSTTDGGIVVTLPPRAPVEAARRFVESQSGWIAARVARLPARRAFGPDGTVPLRGILHRIVHVGGRGTATAGLDEAGQPIIRVPGEAASVAGRVRRFLIREAEADLAAAVLRHTTALGLSARRTTLRDTRSRWGSCSSTGNLNFSWRLILAPPFVLDYLAAHEVAHLKELNHSARFWTVLHDLCPATDEAERWLKANGAGLHRYG